MSRRRNFSDLQIEEALRKCGGIQVRAAVALEQATGISCTRKVINNAVQRSPRLRAVCNEILEEVLDIAEDEAIKKIKSGDTTMIKFFLETRGKTRGYTRRAELTGAAGGAMAFVGSMSVTDPKSLGLAEIRRRNLELIDAVASRLRGCAIPAGAEIDAVGESSAASSWDAIRANAVRGQ
jgi:hypothetical protein